MPALPASGTHPASLPVRKACITAAAVHRDMATHTTKYRMPARSAPLQSQFGSHAFPANMVLVIHTAVLMPSTTSCKTATATTAPAALVLPLVLTYSIVVVGVLRARSCR